MYKQEAVLQLSLTQNYCLVISGTKLHVMLACDDGIKVVVVLSYTHHSSFGNEEIPRYVFLKGLIENSVHVKMMKY